jgi:hypothetical protein
MLRKDRIWRIIVSNKNPTRHFEAGNKTIWCLAKPGGQVREVWAIAANSGAEGGGPFRAGGLR